MLTLTSERGIEPIRRRLFLPAYRIKEAARYAGTFGAPTVNGVPTWALKGRYEAGESIEDIIEDFQISEDDALDALTFEGIQVAE